MRRAARTARSARGALYSKSLPSLTEKLMSDGWVATPSSREQPVKLG